MKRLQHKWTEFELDMLVSKPPELKWKDWLPGIGLPKQVTYKAAVHRYMRAKKQFNSPL